ncbi:vacuolar protein sorting vps16 [Anaeramoeba ignava]|uniref:Vacuolar protein sorting vps16 n=1 Tax=Anaeramoeba ignava TaxID=1746090 RepID=A0A9Q0REZ8_ANAIG|nr:vacuolar protein sorting vps16 [Anaeramoeba ignava]
MDSIEELKNHKIQTWEKLGNKFYEKSKSYDLSIKLQMDEFFISAAPFSGPFALTRDPSKLVKRNDLTQKGKFINIFSLSGIKLHEINCDNKEPIFHFGWTSKEEFILITEKGQIEIYSLDRLSEPDPFDLGSSCEKEGMEKCIISEPYIVGIAKNNQVSIFDLEEARTIMMTNPFLEEDVKPLSMIVLEINEAPHVFVAMNNGKLYNLDAESSTEVSFSFIDSFVAMELSAKNNYIATFSQTGIVRVFTQDFSSCLLQFDMQTTFPPDRFGWCGNDTVLVYFENMDQLIEAYEPNILIMLGPNNQMVRFYFESPIYFHTEIDGARIITSTTSEFLSKVPDEVQSIFWYGATSPEAILFDAYREFKHSDSKADEKIREIMKSGSLQSAIRNCIISAGHETDPKLQPFLLEAAAFGKAYYRNVISSIQDQDPVRKDNLHQMFVEMTMAVKILSAIRDFSVGIFLSFEQFKFLGQDQVIDRLLNRRQYILAHKIGVYLGKKTHKKVLTKWAIALINSPDYAEKNSESENEIYEKITAKFDSEEFRFKRDIPYYEIALEAHHKQKHELAEKLIKKERSLAKQVSLFIRMKKFQKALDIATDSNDSTLIYLVLYSAHRQRRQQMRKQEEQENQRKEVQLQREKDLEKEQKRRQKKLLRQRQSKKSKKSKKSKNDESESEDSDLQFSEEKEFQAKTRMYNYYKHQEEREEEERIKILEQQETELSNLIGNNYVAANMQYLLWNRTNNPRTEFLLQALGLSKKLAFFLIAQSYRFLPKNLHEGESLSQEFLEQKQKADLLKQFFTPDYNVFVLNLRKEKLGSAHKIFAESNLEFFKNSTTIQLSLLTYQEKLETQKSNREAKNQYLGLSLYQTVGKLIRDEEFKEADSFRKKFSIPDKQYWWIKIRNLAQANHYAELRNFAQNKSPIGYEPFARVCIENDSKTKANEFISMIPDLRRRVELFIETENFDRAIQTATSLKDKDLIERVHEMKSSSISFSKK